MAHAEIRHGRRAFTLVELLMVMGIMVLLTGITVIAVAPFLKGRSLSAGARSLQAVIYQARSYAATQGKRATVYFDSQERSMAVYATPDVVRGQFGNRVDEPEHLPPGIRFNNPPVTGGTGPQTDLLIFSPAGSLDQVKMGAGNRIIYLTDESGSVKKIEVVFASGLTKITDE